MGAGIHGGFGNTKGSTNVDVDTVSKSVNDAGDADFNSGANLPTDDSQLKHIFSNREGHLSDTPDNRKLLTDLANDKSKFVGTDKYGNSWNAETTSDGSQNWVRYQNGTINEGGRNATPRTWDDETGYNNTPVKRRKKK